LSIPFPLAGFLSAEHAFLPLPPKSLLLGRQTIPIEWSDIEALAARWALPLPAFERDMVAIYARQNPERHWPTDTAFFAMLGVETIHAIDQMADEGADWRLDNCDMIPPELQGRWGLILNGSVLDNVFDTAAIMRNIDTLRAPGGRVVHSETATANAFSLSGLSRSWFFDFSLYNDYEDVKLYMGSARDWPGLIHGPWSMLGFDPASAARPNAFSLGLGRELGMLVAFAEKRACAFQARMPIQSHYRAEQDWMCCEPTLTRFRTSKRPNHMGAHGAWDYIDAFAGAWRGCGHW